jgi:hypothetical protein
LDGKSTINEIISKIAEDKLELKKWNVTLFISFFSENYHAREYLINLKSEKKKNYKLILKVSRTASNRLNRFIEKEANLLKYLLEKEVECAPKLIGYGYCNGCAYLSIERVEGIKLNLKRESFSNILSRVEGPINMLYGKTKSKEVRSEDLLNKASRFLEIPSEHFELSGILDILEKTLPEDHFLFPVAVVHGNLTYKNITITPKNEIKFLNFTLSGFDEPPIDIPFFVFNFKYRKNRKVLLNPIKAFNDLQLICTPQQFNAFLAIYGIIRSIGIKTEILKTLEDELIIRDLGEFLFPSFEIQTLLEINLNFKH